MKSIIGKLIGSGRPKVIAVFAITRADVERAVKYAREGSVMLPVWAYCLEPAEPVEGCQRFVAGISVLRFRDELRSVWAALSIVAWTGQRKGFAAKLAPFLRAPFRVLVMNEAGDFGAATPAAVWNHARWRARVCLASLSTRCRQRLNDVSGIVHSLAFRAAERASDIPGIVRSLAFRAADYSGSLLLAGLAQASELLLPRASRWAVRRLRNRRPFRMPVEPVTGETFIEIAIKGRAWPRRQVLAALESSADFIVFRCQDEPGEAGALIELALRENAFAAAKQTAHSAWRRKVISKHPFRRLQPGEVAQVFAPFAPLLVLRRETLVRLGHPNAITYGAALMLIFWKASAAGLKSLVAGHADPVTDEPAMALEDAELALRVSFSPSLRTMGPVEPQRLRGNVACSPAHRQGFRDLRRVLVVSPYLPFPLTHGGAVRIFNLCRELSGQVDFVLACFREANETVRYEELHEVFREVHIVDVDEKQFDPLVPAQVCEYRSGAMSELIRRLCRDQKIDLVQLEYTQLAEYRDCTGAVPVVLVEHDITFTLYRQLAARSRTIAAHREYHRWLEFERQALQCSDCVWTMSDDDRSVAHHHGAAPVRIEVIPNGVDLDRFLPVVKSPGPPSLLFIGSFRHLPNLLAFEALRDEIMPLVWKECPDVRLHVIAGPGYARGNKPLDPRIHLEGFVEDVRPAYAGCDVVVIPLPVSAGTNIKVMEAMACGRPVVSTPAGCRGLGLTNGVELLIADLDETFARAIVTLLENSTLRLRMGRDARRTADRRFGWDAIAGEALRSYTELTASAATRIPGTHAKSRTGSPR